MNREVGEPGLRRTRGLVINVSDDHDDDEEEEEEEEKEQKEEERRRKRARFDT